MRKYRLNVLYEDEDLMVVVKPAGVESQASKGLNMDMVSLIRKHLSTSGGSDYVGVIHRLDRPVSGIMVFAKNKVTANRLSGQISERKMEKRYQAIVCGKMDKKCGQLINRLEKSRKNNVSAVSEDGGKEAVLHYRVLDSFFVEEREYTKLEITLDTGRHHQIRVQLAAAGHPLAGDRKYGMDESRDLALKSVYLRFFHEAKHRWMEFETDGF